MCLQANETKTILVYNVLMHFVESIIFETLEIAQEKWQIRRLVAFHMFEALFIQICINLYNFVHSNKFNAFHQNITYIVGILMFPHYVDGT